MATLSENAAALLTFLVELFSATWIAVHMLACFVIDVAAGLSSRLLTCLGDIGKGVVYFTGGVWSFLLGIHT
jgi:hypothetical protein